ncbi:unnamed protein product [Zymoseptoria tritici ST99CH_1E4]|uniref:Uncharacterized protein n=1 Tax=Zymoseptoria tritici ST99CH_1E4 TaxID=1276532 RepID=A0A2H1FX81_ZYMTR|nr:unnamed protein product [Zymoseptoria tritici ST99CH_1E4]
MRELVGSVKKTLVYDRRFSSAPSNETEKAWMGLFPDGLGFVQHPIVSPEISAIAVFHSLHCLHAIHGGYYKAVSMHLNKRQQGNHHDASDGVSASHEDHQDPAHLRHCFDYLRQSLMCGADTNIEPMDKELKGVTGWGYQRTCRDYDAVVAWASENKMGNTTMI